MSYTELCKPISFCSFQFTVATRSGPAGITAPSHVVQELNIAFVPAPIPHRYTMAETAADWDKLLDQGDVTHIDVQVKAFLGTFK